MPCGRALSEIPPGTTRSYARRSPRRSGAAPRCAPSGALTATTGLCIIVPCHRVIGADGALTGYGGGLWRKQWLLAHERAHAAVAGSSRSTSNPATAIAALAAG